MFNKNLSDATIQARHRTDGILEHEHMLVLLEFKHNLDFTQRAEQFKPITQAVCYLRDLRETHGEQLPTSVFVGDVDECFIVERDELMEFVDRDGVDWSVAPSNAHRELPEIYRDLLDSHVTPHVHDVHANSFEFGEVIERLQSIHEDREHTQPITPSNISGVFRSWKERVLQSDDLSPQETVSAFLQSIVGNVHEHPNKSGHLLVGKSKAVRADIDAHHAFLDWFETEYSVSRERNFSAIKDRLIEEDSRRRHGEFFTPATWVDQAHSMLKQILGPDWRNEWVVWDCSCGTANLTRDYTFDELYMSTIHQSDVDDIEEMGYNPNGEAFQFDFLNDYIPGAGQEEMFDMAPKLPDGLKEALQEGKKMLFLNNPPFGTASDSAKKGANKEGVSFTGVKDKMDLGRAGNQLYAQFMWRMSELVERFDLEEAVMALYSRPLFMTGYSFCKFRSYFYDCWSFEDGFIFPSGEFSGTSQDEWPVSFSVWTRGTESNQKFDFTVKDREVDTVVNQREHTFYYPDERASSWVKAPRDMWWGKGEDVPQLSNAIKCKEGGRCTLPTDALGYMCNLSNDVAHRQSVYWVSSANYEANGVSVFSENFRRCAALFCARKTIDINWINYQDEYCAPDTNHPDYEQWVNDAVVYSLFNSHSQQSSLRDIDYKGDSWDITNEFFFMPLKEMRELADAHGFGELYQDTIAHDGERYVQQQLKDLELSEDARTLLEEARSLIRDSFSHRPKQHQKKPEMHLNAWDAGWYQIRKGILEDLFPDRYDDFVQSYRDFEDRMREGVYTFGFLKQ
ncbi:MAG: hypothetical protein ABEN55_21180 [Bradymonadaceae bacterium]